MKLIVTLVLSLTVLLSLSGYAQNENNHADESHMNSYETEWKQVDEFIKKGLPKSALEIVDKIYDDALATENYAQSVKALMHKFRFEFEVQEIDLVDQINQIDREIAGSKTPHKQLLTSIQAEMIWSYYSQRRWEILNRTEVAGSIDEDMRTWDAAKFVDTTFVLYQQSLADSEELQKTRLDLFDSILTPARGSRKYRPTLYDLLAHRALSFFMNQETGLTRPARSFNLDQQSVFGSAHEFVETKFHSEDPRSMLFHAVQTLKSLTAFHLDDSDPVALVDLELVRAEMASAHSSLLDAAERYIDMLERLEKATIGFPASTHVTHKIAEYYADRGDKHTPGNENTFKWDRKKAHGIATTGVERFPDSEGAQNCRALLAELEEKELDLEIEKVNVPKKPFRALVTYRNVRNLYLRAVPVSPELQKAKNKELARDRRRNQKLITFYKSLEAAAEWRVTLPDDGDLRSHKVEIVVPELPHGRYVIMAGTSKDFSVSKNGTVLTSAWCSQIGFVQKDDADGRSTFFVMDRTSGKPIQGVTVQGWYNKYDPDTRLNKEVALKRYETDEDGRFVIEPADFSAAFRRGRHERFNLDFTYGEDRLFLDDHFTLPYEYSVSEKTQIRTFLFTDRTIYRPGQTVFYKGILVERGSEKSEIITDHDIKIELRDVNRKVVGSMTHTTNEFGTYSGSFVLPSSGLTGSFTLADTHGSVRISVEEYKRPRFEVEFEPITGSFRLNDSVKVVAKANSYAGANLVGAEVKYRVVRNVYFPYYNYDWSRRFAPVNDVEIANGLTMTGKDGTAPISFVAYADKYLSKAQMPSYTYTVYADVTDIAGETHSTQTNVRVGTVAIDVNIDLPKSLNRDVKTAIEISTKNLNGQFEPAQGDIVIFKLIEPGRVLRTRFWDQPDTFLLSRQEYEKLFPNDVYKDEDNFQTWERTSAVAQYRFNTSESSELGLEFAQMAQGRYVLELSTEDAFGKPVTLKRFFTLYSATQKSLPMQEALWSVGHKITAEPGDRAEILWGSSAGEVYAIMEVFEGGERVKRERLRRGDEKNRLEITVLEHNRGGFSVGLFFVKHGRIYEFDYDIFVPWKSKDLKIIYETFRDKLRPGQEEEWRLRISGPEGDKVGAEMVAAMYDASLDAFQPHMWRFNVLSKISGLPYHYGIRNRAAFSHSRARAYSENWNADPSRFHQQYDQLNWFGYRPHTGRYPVELSRTHSVSVMAMDGPPGVLADQAQAYTDVSVRGGRSEPKSKEAAPPVPSPPPVQIRKNLNETAFFYPHLQTDESGDVVISFTMPEALTEWKFLGLAHTKELHYALTTNSIVTQKELMITPNAPRFLREGDEIVFSGKVDNLSDSTLSGMAMLEIYDAITMQRLDADFHSAGTPETFTVSAGENAAVQWTLQIPEKVRAVTYRIIARAGNFSDGEENTLPVLTNRMLVTESLPLAISGKGEKEYRFENLLNSGDSKTLQHHQLTLELTSNPAWYAVQALPYLMEFPHDCSEQVFSRYYANSLAAHIANSKPKIQRVFESWRDTDALQSNLEKNEELKSLLLEETPWVLQAQNEAERKKRVGLLFDLNRMASEQKIALQKLAKAQNADGGWPWFPGMRSNRYITQHIVSGMGHLSRLGVLDPEVAADFKDMLQRALIYMDSASEEEYNKLLERKADLEANHLGSIAIHYLYARSFFRATPVVATASAAYEYWEKQSEKFWVERRSYDQGMIALAALRSERTSLANAISNSLKERAISSEELGTYWKDIQAGYYWFQAPIETQSLLIELFWELGKDTNLVDGMRLWLLKQKQTQDWKTTKATANACYALLLRGSDWLQTESAVTVSLGSIRVDPNKQDEKTPEAGTGYFKRKWSAPEVAPNMGEVSLTKSSDGPAWGAVYWQYFEQLDRIKTHETPLKLEKQLFVERDTRSGPVLEAVDENTGLKPGDLLKVRIELRVDRRMEYVHMKDMRASAFEPLNVFSQFKYQDGLSYYESTRDASTNFFFPALNKGTYVFEYPLRVTHYGDFSNGITTIQCMYAPEFTSHSEGVRVEVGG